MAGTGAVVGLLVICVAVIGFVALVSGEELDFEEIPTIELPAPIEGSNGTGFISMVNRGAASVLNFFRTAVIGTIDVVIVAISVCVWFLQFLTLPIPGAPTFVRVMLAVPILGGLAFAIVSLIRGGS